MPTDIGDTPQDLAGLDPESRQIVLDTLGLVRKRLLPKEKILELDKKEVFPEEIIREMMGPDIGLQLLFIPEEYGGIGGGDRDACALIREMARICLGVATAFFAIQLGADPILFAATKEQKQKWLGKIAEADALVAYAVTEAEAGSNLAALKTKAEPVRNDAGEITGYVINGTKQFISNGGYADFITVLAKAPEGPTFFIVEKGMEGFHQGKGEEKHGIRASNTSPLTFTDVSVPVKNLLGGVPGNGLKQANMVFGHTRLMVAAMGLGAGEAALDIVIDYAKKRVQFGSPLSEKQGYTHKLVVPHAVRFEAAAAYMDEQATRLDAGEKDLQVEGSIAKYFATEAGNKAADDAIQALGGYGYITEYEVEKIKRDVKITCIYEGTSEIQQNIISTFRWRTTVKSKGDYYGAMAQEMEALHASMPEIGAATYARAAKTLNETIMFVHNHKLTRQQYIMFCLADMMTHVEVGVSMARKAKGLIRERSSQAKKIVIVSRIFASEVIELITTNAIKIVTGSGLANEEIPSTLKEKMGYEGFMASHSGLIQDMDAVADILFGRE
ncbi:MAG: acyl-CoA dehydrogenase family protein [Deltaproteobacteria bacterium]|nr:acyl-CoA dehydrogenase family protein [Deltaproteobacteria bacterium]MBW1794153.1 acyl-CoA dehydrogenase family protein [Deltaproteobacteria bacterium]MBW2331441.1 acyl-CoA dehydrogenase family protein [Deltaproteobacteria bacterium]